MLGDMMQQLGEQGGEHAGAAARADRAMRDAVEALRRAPARPGDRAAEPRRSTPCSRRRAPWRSR